MHVHFFLPRTFLVEIQPPHLFISYQTKIVLQSNTTHCIWIIPYCYIFFLLIMEKKKPLRTRKALIDIFNVYISCLVGMYTAFVHVGSILTTIHGKSKFYLTILFSHTSVHFEVSQCQQT